jgi:hypothetical protein
MTPQPLAAMGSAMMATAMTGATPGQKRNPLMMLAMTLGAVVAANVITSILATLLDSIGATIGGLLGLAAYVLYFVVLFKQVKELRMYLGADAPPAWTFLIPFIKVPAAMAMAKQRAGCVKPMTVPFWMFIVIPAYALQIDLNQVWDPQSPTG